MSQSLSVITNKPGDKTFVFEGDLTIQVIETTKDEISNNLTDASQVVFDLNGINLLDVCFLQLLYSTVLHCEKNKISVQIVSNSLSDDSKHVIAKSGFDKIICK